MIASINYHFNTLFASMIESIPSFDGITTSEDSVSVVLGICGPIAIDECLLRNLGMGMAGATS